MEAVYEYVKPGKENVEWRRTWIAVSANEPDAFLEAHLRKQGTKSEVAPFEVFVPFDNDAIDERIVERK